MTVAVDARTSPPFEPHALRGADGRFVRRVGSAAARPSGRQIEALDLVADGLASHEIAHRLGIGPDAVATRLKQAAKVLGTGNRAAMVGECYRRAMFVPRPDGGERPAVGAELLVLLPLVARGGSYAGMAVALGVSEQAVKSRMAALCRVLGANGGVHLVRRAVDAGLLTVALELAEPIAAPEPVAPKPAAPIEPKLMPVSVVSPLSPPQERVLRMLAFGLEPDAVAMRLGMGSGAVRETARAAMVALNARTLPHAVLLACQAGILPGGGP